MVAEKVPKVAEGAAVFRFAGFTLDLHSGLLSDGRAPIALRPKSMELLTVLVRQAGRVVPKDELMETVWPSVYVTEDSLTQCIHDIRRALGERSATLLKTVPRRGYIFSRDALEAAGNAEPGSEPSGQAPAFAFLPPGEAYAFDPGPKADDTLPKLANRKLSAVLYADIQGFSRLMDRDEAGTVVRVSRILAMIRSLVGDYGGKVHNTAGDSIMALFPSAAQALHFAVEMQMEVARESAWSDEGDPVAFRVGIAIGDTITSDGDVYGHTINLAARIQSLADPGGICVSDFVYRAVKDRSNVAFQPLGKQVLKNIDEPVDVYSVLFQAPRAEATVALSLPNGSTEVRRTTDSSIAVLPLENATSDAADAHIVQGIVSDIISSLCRFRNLMVIARHSTFLVSSQLQSLREIGQALGVRYLLTGSYRRFGPKIRINVELVEAETENIIWSEKYDGTLDDIFSFLDDVTATATSRLAFHIDTAERRRLSIHNHPNLHAYGLILRGQDLGYRFRPETNHHARILFEQAREIDPQYGRSYAAISRTFNVEWRYSWTRDPEAALDMAVALAKQAVERDDLDARGFSEMGIAHLYKKQHEEALAAYERAIELNPNDADLLAEMGDCLVYVRQAERSVELLHRAMRLNPYHPDSYLWYLGDAYFHLGDYEKTISTLLKMRDQSEGHRLLAASYALLGRQADAERHAAAVMEAHPNFTIEKWRKVPPNKYPEDLEVFIDGLRRAGLR